MLRELRPRSNVLLATSIATAVLGIAVGRMYAAGGNLDKPGIAIPATDGVSDATVAAMNKVLQAHEKQFVGGHWLNSHTVLDFAGGTKTINSLLDELSKIEGATVYVKFAREAQLVEFLVGDDEEPEKPYDCQIKHSASADAHFLSLTIHLGKNVSLEDLELPAIRGHAAP